MRFELAPFPRLAPDARLRIGLGLDHHVGLHQETARTLLRFLPNRYHSVVARPRRLERSDFCAMLHNCAYFCGHPYTLRRRRVLHRSRRDCE